VWACLAAACCGATPRALPCSETQTSPCRTRVLPQVSLISRLDREKYSSHDSPSPSFLHHACIYAKAPVMLCPNALSKCVLNPQVHQKCVEGNPLLAHLLMACFPVDNSIYRSMYRANPTVGYSFVRQRNVTRSCRLTSPVTLLSNIPIRQVNTPVYLDLVD
jgi:hypothetical protein